MSRAAEHGDAGVVPAFADAALSVGPAGARGRTTDAGLHLRGKVERVLADAVVRRVTTPEPANLAVVSRRLLEVIDRMEGLLDTCMEGNHQPPRPGDVPHSQANAPRLHILHPGVEPTSFEEGLQATIHWLRTQ